LGNEAFSRKDAKNAKESVRMREERRRFFAILALLAGTYRQALS